MWRRAVVTGGSAGIGAAFARELANGGTDLVLVARREVPLKALAEELEHATAANVETTAADLSDRKDIRRVEDLLAETDIDLLVNNAGGGEPGRGAFVDHDRDAVEAQAVLNALSVLRLTHAAARAMRARGGGTIIQVSAGVAFYPIPYGATYAASKAFVNHLSEAVGYELNGSGVSVTVSCPGFTRTDAPKRLGFDETNIPRWLWADADDVARDALAAAARGRPITSPGLVNKIGAATGSRFPRIAMRLAARTASLGAARASL